MRPGIVHELHLAPADAARLDLGRYVPVLAFDGMDRPVVFLRAEDGSDALIWSCERYEACWLGEPDMNIRLRQLRDLRASLPEPPDSGATLYSVFPQDWGPDVEQQYRDAKAAGDDDTRFQLIEQQTGIRMRRTPPGQVIEIWVRTDGPQ